MKLSEIAQRLRCELTGDGSLEIHGVAGMEHAGPTDLTFLANPKYAHKVQETKAGAIVAGEPLGSLPTVVSPSPYLDFARALELFYRPPRPEPGVHPLAFVAETAQIGAGASIAPFCFVGERVRLGRNAVLYPHAVIYEGAHIGDDFVAHSHATVREFCRVGDRVILQNGVVVGGDGFGFAKQADGTHYKIVQSGIAVVEDDVEIQSLSAIDRATMGETRVRRGAKVDNLVQVGHASEIGEDNIICAQTGLAGSSILEKDVLLAGQAGISGHLRIGKGSIVYAQSGVGGDLPENSRVSGSPAFDAAEWRRTVATLPKLPDLMRQIRALERRVQSLEESSQHPKE